MMVRLIDDTGEDFWVNPLMVAAVWAAETPNRTLLRIAGFDESQVVIGEPASIVAALFPQPDVI